MNLLAMLKGTVSNNHMLKIYALLCAYGLWLFIGQYETTHMQATLPVYLYGSEPIIKKCTVPETIALELSAKKNELMRINQEQLGVHINADNLAPGKNIILLTSNDLLLNNRILVKQHAPLFIWREKDDYDFADLL